MAFWLEVTNSEDGAKELVNIDRVDNIAANKDGKGGSTLWFLGGNRDAHIDVDENYSDFKAALNAKGKSD
jgi:hypothetical protein